MKKSLLFILLLSILSCKKDKINSLESAEDAKTEVKDSIVADISDFDQKYGLWSGEFVADVINYDHEGKYSYLNRLTLVIQDIKGDKLTGYSVSAGNVRPFTGLIMQTDSTRYVVAKEPGDHKYDGVFKFNIADNNDSVWGEWISNRKDLPVLSRTFSMKRNDFKYNPNLMLDGSENEEYGSMTVDWVNGKNKIMEYEGEKYEAYVNRAVSDKIFEINASTRKLTEKELKNLRKLDLEIIRNTIYARHGYSFSNRGVRQYFDNVEWYIPLYTNVEDQLTPIEKENIALLKRLEKYAEDYYQQYGR